MYKLRIIAILVLSLAVTLPAAAQSKAEKNFMDALQNGGRSKKKPKPNPFGNNSGRKTEKKTKTRSDSMFVSSEPAKAIVFDEAALGLSYGVKECVESTSPKGGKRYIFKSSGHCTNLWQLFDADRKTFRINRNDDGFISSAEWLQDSTECTATLFYTPSGILEGWEKATPGSTHRLTITLDDNDIPVSSELTITSPEGKIITEQQYSEVKTDRNGNWIRRNVSETMTYIVAVNGQTHSETRNFTETRRISYFAAPKKKQSSIAAPTSNRIETKKDISICL